MSNYYPMWWDTPITVFNKYTDTQTRVVKWYKTTLDNCFWKDTGNKVNVGDTLLETNDIICRIPKQENYLPPFEWVNIPNDEMSNYFTLSVGDIIIRGHIEDDIDEYISGKRSTDIISKYKDNQGCLEIKKVAINTNTGMVTPHYNVKGE